ncbi:MAG: hypothetical protein ACXW15_10420 [Acidimicrobiia bacterium]
MTTKLDKVRVRIDEPGQPNVTIPERRDLLDWLGWRLALVGPVFLIVAVAVVIG